MPDVPDTPDQGDIEYDLVTPFVAVASKGGPFEDEAYCAGYEMGQLDAALATCPDEHAAVVRTENALQADLVAMRHGYRMRSEPNDQHPEWACVAFEPTEETPDA